MAEVRLEGVSKRFGDVVALESLDLHATDDDFLVLLGPSGCGKSTALRCIAGLEEPTEGRVLIGDRDVTAAEPKDRDVAMVFQSYALYPHKSVRQNIEFPLIPRDVPKDERRRASDEAAALLGLSELMDRKPRALSGGQRQRVALARAIVRRPAAFLMDEPLSNLDAKLRVQMRAEIARIQRELGVTTLYVTHDQVEAMTMGDRVAVLKGGVLQQVDTPQNLYDNPDNVFVAAFIGSPSMNLYEGVLTRSDDGASLKLGSQTLAVPADVLERKPAMSERLGDTVTVGIRPEDMEDVTLEPDHPRDQLIRTDVELVEALGSELMVHASIDAPKVHSGDPDVHDEGTAGAAGTPLVARFSPRSRVSRGETIEVAIDTRNLYFFDSRTGLTLR